MSKLLDQFFGTGPAVKTSSGRGGARPNTGPKPGHERVGADTPDSELTDYQRLERAKAEKEFQLARQAKVKADLDEGAVVYREQVQVAAAQAFAAISQSLDAIGDALDRQGVEAAVVEKVVELINHSKLQLMKDLEKTYNAAQQAEKEADQDD